MSPWTSESGVQRALHRSLSTVDMMKDQHFSRRQTYSVMALAWSRSTM